MGLRSDRRFDCIRHMDFVYPLKQNLQSIKYGLRYTDDRGY